MQTEFRTLSVDEIPFAYQIIVERTDWLLKKGVRQWLRPLPEQIIQQRQAEGQLFGYWVNQQLVAIVSLLKTSGTLWDKALLNGSFLFVATLASTVSRSGRGYGAECLNTAESYARQNSYEKLYLDCIENAGVLPAFYTSHGYVRIAEKQIMHTDREVNVVLMSKTL